MIEDTRYYYNNLNQLIQAGDEIFFHDARGNIIKRITPGMEINYVWDLDNRLIRVDKIENGQTSKTVDYAYNGLDKRISRTVTEGTNITETTHVNNNASVYVPLLEYENGNLKRKYLSGAYLEDGQSYYLLKGVGEKTLLFNNQAEEIAFIEYDPFGSKIKSGGNSSSMDLWQGEHLDPDTGLVYLRNRYYDPRLGRFLSLDAHPGFMYSPQTLNPYVYCHNDPINFADPLGLEEYHITIITEIREPDFQAGMKLTHEIILDTDAQQVVSSDVSTGITTVFGIPFSSRSDDFNVSELRSSDNVSVVTVDGTTGSKLFPANIDYKFDIIVNDDTGNIAVPGSHDGYPSYAIDVGDKRIYDHQQNDDLIYLVMEMTLLLFLFANSLSWIRQLNAVFCTNHLGQKELQKSLDAPSGCACVFLQPFASKAFAQKSHV